MPGRNMTRGHCVRCRRDLEGETAYCYVCGAPVCWECARVTEDGREQVAVVAIFCPRCENEWQRAS